MGRRFQGNRVPFITTIRTLSNFWEVSFFGSLSNGVVLIKSNGRKCFGISFLALLNDFTDVLLDQDTHPEMTKNPKSKGNSLGLFANTFSAFGNPFELVDRFSLAASLSEFVGY